MSLILIGIRILFEISFIHQERQRNREGAFDFLAAGFQRVGMGYERDKRRNNVATDQGYDIIKLSQDFDIFDAQTYLLLRLPESSLEQVGIRRFPGAPGKAHLPFVKYHFIASLREQDMVLPPVKKERYHHCRSLEVFAGDSLYLTMMEDFLDLLSHHAVIIPPLTSWLFATSLHQIVHRLMNGRKETPEAARPTFSIAHQEKGERGKAADYSLLQRLSAQAFTSYT
jgi:hypothetical protein